MNFYFILFYFCKKKKTNCRFMAGNANSGAKNIGSIVGASASPSSIPSLLDSTMPPVNTENVECVRNVGIQNPNSIEALPPKSKSNVQKSIVWEHFTKVEWVILKILNQNATIAANCLVVTPEG
jgi:hypothetical protein